MTKIRDLFLAIMAVLVISTTATLANDIYITQSGDNLDLDIDQDGQNNVIGTSTTDVTLAGDTMNFDITQTGNMNTIAAVIKGATYTGTWAFTGDSNTVDLLCSSGSAGNCDSVTLNITATGDGNQFDFDIGETASADSSTVSFTVTGDNSIINSDIDGVSAALTVTIDNSASLATTSANSDEGVALTTTQSGIGDSQGHTATVDVTGGGGTIDISQTGVYDNTIDLTIDGDSFDVDITQSD